MWLLVLTSALPAALITRLSWLVLSGSIEATFESGPPSTGRRLLAERWASLWWSYSSIPVLLLSAPLPLLVLAALVIADRPQALVPTGLARIAATVVAAVTALLGLLGVAGFLAQLLDLLPVNAWASSSSELEAFAPFAAVVLVTTVLGVLTTAALWPQAGEHRSNETAIDTIGVEAVADEPGPGATALPVVIDEEVAGRPPLPQPAATPGLPSPSATDLDHYRRR